MNPQRTIRANWLPALAALAVTALTAPGQSANFSTFKIITDRNIFNPNRQPLSRFNTVRSGSVQQITEFISLVGTMSYEKGDYAFFDGTSPKYRKAVRPGESVAGFAVTAVGTNFVKMLQGSNGILVTVGTKLRRDDEGNWAIPDSAYVDSRSRRKSGWQRDYGTNRPPVEVASQTNTNAPATNDLTATEPYNLQPEVTAATDPATDFSQPFETTSMPTDPTSTPAEASNAPVDNATDPLTRLMQLRAQEEQQLQHQ